MSASELSPEYVRLLEPPSGGLTRLQRRLAKPRQRQVLRPLVAFASFGLMAILAGSVWTTFEAAERERQAINELESLFTSAILPPLTIDGLEPIQLEVDRDDLLVFLVQK